MWSYLCHELITHSSTYCKFNSLSCLPCSFQLGMRFVLSMWVIFCDKGILKENLNSPTTWDFSIHIPQCALLLFLELPLPFTCLDDCSCILKTWSPSFCCSHGSSMWLCVLDGVIFNGVFTFLNICHLHSFDQWLRAYSWKKFCEGMDVFFL